MSLIFVTGTSTSGKSTMAKELSKRGYLAYDTEHNGIGAYYNKATGKFAAGFGEMPERTPEWLDKHHWLISTERIKELVRQHPSKTIFLCGGSSNAAEIRDMCDVTIWLKTNEETIRKRVNNPRDHDYGTKPHELARAISTGVDGEAEYANYGAVLVDATQRIGKVVDDVIAVVQQ